MQNQPRISRVNKYIHLYSPYSQNPLRRCYFKSRASMKTHTLHREEIGEGPRSECVLISGCFYEASINQSSGNGPSGERS